MFASLPQARTQWMLSLWRLSPQWLLQLFSQCPHSQTPYVEGKTFCVSCHQGIVFRWMVLRCTGCHSIRSARYWFRQIIAADAHCRHCGQQQTRSVYLDSPSFFQLRHAVLHIQTEDDYLNELFTASESFQNRSGSWHKVWLKKMWAQTARPTGQPVLKALKS